MKMIFVLLALLLVPVYAAPPGGDESEEAQNSKNGQNKGKERKDKIDDKESAKPSLPSFPGVQPALPSHALTGNLNLDNSMTHFFNPLNFIPSLNYFQFFPKVKDELQDSFEFQEDNNVILESEESLDSTYASPQEEFFSLYNDRIEDNLSHSPKNLEDNEDEDEDKDKNDPLSLINLPILSSISKPMKPIQTIQLSSRFFHLIEEEVLHVIFKNTNKLSSLYVGPNHLILLSEEEVIHKEVIDNHTKMISFLTFLNKDGYLTKIKTLKLQGIENKVLLKISYLISNGRFKNLHHIQINHKPKSNVSQILELLSKVTTPQLNQITYNSLNSDDSSPSLLKQIQLYQLPYLKKLKIRTLKFNSENFELLMNCILEMKVSPLTHLVLPNLEISDNALNVMGKVANANKFLQLKKLDFTGLKVIGENYEFAINFFRNKFPSIEILELNSTNLTAQEFLALINAISLRKIQNIKKFNLPLATKHIKEKERNFLLQLINPDLQKINY